ncbi:hypothetical protein IscW_ISCW019942, partial [Ixodes scapularis]
VDVKTTKSEDGTCWAVLVVTPIMRRTQGLDTARQIVFLDSTASCDESQSTVTVVLTATPAGAIPLAVLLHSSQSTESYTAAFRLLKQNYPLCFGGAHIMYATSSEEFDCAIEELRQMPHRGYVARVEAFLERKTESVLLFRLAITTRGHNTNNFAEATIRILKDVVLCRRKAYNAVALVPSGREDDKVYQVFQDIGACTCRAGQQGAFCKHQALIHNIYGGAFPNAPPLTPQDRHQLGLLALGDKCSEANFFRDFTNTLKEQPSSNTGGDKQAPPQLLPQLDQQMETVEQPPVVASTSNDQRHQIQEEQWRHHSLAADNPFYSTILEQVLSEMKKVNKEPQVIASYLATKAAYSSARRRGRRIKVQPTGIARRRPDISRGAGRVPAGRPSKGPGTKKTKRAHALHLSVKSGVLHVKSHGTGH